MKRKLFTKTDVIVALVAIIVCISIIIVRQCFSVRGKTVAVYYNNEKKDEFSLYGNTEKTFEFGQGKNTVCVKNGECYVSFADCRDKICVHHEKIKNKGQTIVCLPHKLIIEVE